MIRWLRSWLDSRRQPRWRRQVQAAFHGGRPSEAIRPLRRLAALHDAAALFQLGSCYANGLGVIRNLPESLVWMRWAAERDHPEACWSLARILLHGPGNQHDGANPLRWYGTETSAEDDAGAPAPDTAGETTNRDLFFPAGTGVATDPAEGLRWLLRAAELEHPLALV